MPRFCVLAEVDFPLDRFQQELLSGNFGVQLEVVGKALASWLRAGTGIDPEDGIGLCGLKVTIIISLVKPLDLSSASERTNPDRRNTCESNHHANEGTVAFFAVSGAKNRKQTGVTRSHKPGRRDHPMPWQVVTGKSVTRTVGNLPYVGPQDNGHPHAGPGSLRAPVWLRSGGRLPATDPPLSVPFCPALDLSAVNHF